MRIKLEQIGSTLVAKLSGELDQHWAAELREEIDRELSRNHIINLVFDLAEVSFMDSSGIGVILGRYKQIKARGGKTLIVRAQPQVDKILELAGIKKLLECS